MWKADNLPIACAQFPPSGALLDLKKALTGLPSTLFSSQAALLEVFSAHLLRSGAFKVCPEALLALRAAVILAAGALA